MLKLFFDIYESNSCMIFKCIKNLKCRKPTKSLKKTHNGNHCALQSLHLSPFLFIFNGYLLRRGPEVSNGISTFNSFKGSLGIMIF